MLEDVFPFEIPIVQLPLHMVLCHELGRQLAALAQFVQIVDVAELFEDCLSVIVGSFSRPILPVGHDPQSVLQDDLHIGSELLELAGEAKGQNRVHQSSLLVLVSLDNDVCELLDFMRAAFPLGLDVRETQSAESRIRKPVRTVIVGNRYRRAVRKQTLSRRWRLHLPR